MLAQHLAPGNKLLSHNKRGKNSILTKYTMGFLNHHVSLASLAASFLTSHNAHAQKDRMVICDSHFAVIYSRVEHRTAYS